LVEGRGSEDDPDWLGCDVDRSWFDEFALGVSLRCCVVEGCVEDEDPLGDCAKAAVPRMRQTAVVARSCLFMLELLVTGMNCQSP
jgi:hypothetical protein